MSTEREREERQCIMHDADHKGIVRSIIFFPSLSPEGAIKWTSLLGRDYNNIYLLGLQQEGLKRFAKQRISCAPLNQNEL
jgi:hypothetical protein